MAWLASPAEVGTALRVCRCPYQRLGREKRPRGDGPRPLFATPPLIETAIPIPFRTCRAGFAIDGTRRHAMSATLAHRAAASLLLLAVFIAGCSQKPKPNHVTQAEADSLAKTAAKEVLDGAPLGLARAMILRPVAVSGSSVRRPQRVASLGAVTDDSTSISWEITCYGLDGRQVDWTTVPYDSLDRLVLVWEYYMNGDAEDAGWAYHFHWRSKGRFDFSGFSSQSTEFRCNGNSRDSMDVRLAKGPNVSQDRGSWSIEFDQIRWGKDFDQHPYPRGGVLALRMDVHWRTVGQEPRDLNVAVRIEFNGTRYAVMVVDDIYRYQLDLETGATTRISA